MTNQRSEPSVRYFTLDEANRTLPYVSRIVADIVAEYDHWREEIARYEALAANRQAVDRESEEQVHVRERVDSVARRINGLIDELSRVGCVFKGFDGGLVDFYGKLGGRDVFLCWKLGEREIRYWHELDGGFAGRQELVEQLVDGEPS